MQTIDTRTVREEGGDARKQEGEDRNAQGQETECTGPSALLIVPASRGISLVFGHLTTVGSNGDSAIEQERPVARQINNPISTLWQLTLDIQITPVISELF
jgi:hypothetical protein